MTNRALMTRKLQQRVVPMDSVRWTMDWHDFVAYWSGDMAMIVPEDTPL